MSQTILAVENLTRYYDSFAALKEVSFEMKKGEILGFLGPNGAGKTTAIRMILGILQPSGGEVAFYMNGTSEALDKQRVGYLPEERGLYDDAKVLDTLLYMAALKGTPRAKALPLAQEWLETMELTDFANHKLEKLSKGMQQKVQFIATVIHQPDLVVLDEPFSGLDPINQDLFKDLILRLRDQGMTVLLSAHQMNVVQELCDRIFLIDKGAPVLYGTLEEIRDQHEENVVELSYTSQEGLEEYLHKQPHIRELAIQNNSARFKMNVAVDPNIFLQDVGAICKIKSLKIEKPSLHEIFIDTVKGGLHNE